MVASYCDRINTVDLTSVQAEETNQLDTIFPAPIHNGRGGASDLSWSEPPKK